MPASGSLSLADANMWLALAFSDHVPHSIAKQWFDAQTRGSCAFCRVTQLALLRLLANAKIMGRFVQSQQNAWTAFDRIVADPRMMYLEEPPGLEAKFRRLTQSAAPSNAVWTDAYLAAFALCSQARLVTFDRGFSRFAGLDLLVLS